LLDFLNFISDLDIDAIMIHGRTLSQGFSGMIDFTTIKKAKDYFGGLIFGNGNIYTPEQAQEMIDKTGVDGIGIARGAYGRPWIFQEVKSGDRREINFAFVREVACRHAELSYTALGRQGMIEMRKHLCWYVNGLPQASAMRKKFIKIESLAEIQDIFQEFAPQF
jgi:tRNA-dihydrouridine synthase